MSNYLATDDELTQTANAIRTRGGTSASIAYVSGVGFKAAIDAIPSGGTNVGTSYDGVTQLRTVSGGTEELQPPLLNTNYGGTT